MNLRSLTASLGTALTLGFVSMGAHAYKLDISALSSATTDITLDAGTYTLSWIGVAEGGLFNGWQYNTAASGNWREAFTVTGLNSTAVTVDVYSPANTYYSNFATASDALAAAKAGSYTVLSSGSVIQSNISAPLTFTLAQSTTLRFGVPDYLFSDNTGGVSLNITAVPEPESLALMLAGLGAVGFAVRRRTA